MSEIPTNQTDPDKQQQEGDEQSEGNLLWVIPLAAYFLIRRGIRRRISDEQILGMADKWNDDRKAELSALGDRLAAGDITTRQFQALAGELLSIILTSNYILGRGGKAQMNNRAKKDLTRLIQEQLFNGKGEDGKAYGLRYLIDDFRKDRISEARFKARLDMYGRSAWRAYWRGSKEAHRSGDHKYGYRILDGSNHCSECVTYAAMPPQPVGSLIMPTEKCSCRTNCRCRIVWLTLEQAIQRGMNN